ncbi:TetR/AcrR family transcriptional regulator [Tengunoibacter tsumagoiensis]|uniref:TetR family transcriptional regulator n=1 Tax=Tengunoibacter tsumagoiensis TaxID=2014871 RepID=A0A402A6K1_9CHLR|nr:TetR/AcrR family transcriptional regulator [Tengunoibacter tsumagoiensis]GCE14773.1 TetR family transcriptional regulator [Tengunoibacter tsumagoiensis]
MSPRAGLDQTAVIESAALLVDEEGIEQLSLGRLAERLGIKKPSLYNHVAGLPGLKRNLAVYCLREVLARFSRAAIGKSGADAIIAFADAYRSYAREHPGRYALTLQAPDPTDQELVEISTQTVDVARALLAPYKLEEEETIHAIRSLRSIVHGFVSLEAAGGFGMPINLDASFHWLLTTFTSTLERIS